MTDHDHHETSVRPSHQATARAVVTGSEKSVAPGATRVAPADPGEELSVTVMVRRRSSSLPDVHGPATPRVSRAAFAEQFGADDADLAAVTAFAHAHRLTVQHVDAAARTVRLTGNVEQMDGAFAVRLQTYTRDSGEYRGRQGAITVPVELGEIVTGVFGLDNRQQVRPRVQVRAVRPMAAADPSFSVPQIAELYDFPTDVTGAGQTIAIAEFGGGYHPGDLTKFFADLGIPKPTVSSVKVDGAGNSPGDPADVEVVLDIEVAGAVAPGAHIAVYFAPNTDQGFIDAVTRSIHDGTRNPSVLSISWGGPEEDWTAQTRAAIDSAFADAALLGVTVLCAAGDHGSADRAADQQGYDGLAHVDFPAASPHATACGGTRLAGANGVIDSEVVWNDGDGWATGGGVSETFDAPDWQKVRPTSVNPPHTRQGRGVPDISGNADSATGYRIHVNGRDGVVGGTSAVAPLWAGLIALVNEAAGRHVGFINPLLYAAPAATFRDITRGSNAIGPVGGAQPTAGYDAAPGWDPCTGLGSPVGTAVRDALLATQPVAAAG